VIRGASRQQHQIAFSQFAPQNLRRFRQVTACVGGGCLQARVHGSAAAEVRRIAQENHQIRHWAEFREKVAQAVATVSAHIGNIGNHHHAAASLGRANNVQRRIRHVLRGCPPAISMTA
jgi:hypothetical protein